MNPTARAWLELVRGPAALTVPGDLLAGAAAVGGATVRRTGPAVGASLCLYWAGMTLNDWADREVDAEERPGRPIPSGRIRPGAALAAATALTGAGLGLAAATGSRRTLSTAAALTAAVWGYDLWLKNTPAGPAAMASARGLNLLLGAAATGRPMAPAARPAALLAAHTLALTTISRHEVHGGPRTTPATALATTAAIAATSARPSHPLRSPRAAAVAAAAANARVGAAAKPFTPTGWLRRAGASPRPWHARPGALAALALARAVASGGAPASAGVASSPDVVATNARSGDVAPDTGPASAPPPRAVAPAAASPGRAAFAGAAGWLAAREVTRTDAGTGSRVGERAVVAASVATYLATVVPPLVRAVREPTGARMRAGVVGGLQGLLPLQATLAARAGASRLAPPALLLTLAAARRLSRKVTPT